MSGSAPGCEAADEEEEEETPKPKKSVAAAKDEDEQEEEEEEEETDDGEMAAGLPKSKKSAKQDSARCLRSSGSIAAAASVKLRKSSSIHVRCASGCSAAAT